MIPGWGPARWRGGRGGWMWAVGRGARPVGRGTARGSGWRPSRTPRSESRADRPRHRPGRPDRPNHPAFGTATGSDQAVLFGPVGQHPGAPGTGWHGAPALRKQGAPAPAPPWTPKSARSPCSRSGDRPGRGRAVRPRRSAPGRPGHGLARGPRVPKAGRIGPGTVLGAQIGQITLLSERRPAQTRPCSNAKTTSCTRSRSASLPRMRLMWVFTVASERNSRCAISALESPRAASAKISRSRSVSSP